MSYIPYKKPGTILEYTEPMIEELANCEDDPVYFMEHFVKIQTEGGAKLFEPYQYQRDMIKSFAEHRNTVALLGRQLGKCVSNGTVISIRNKKTGEIQKISIGDFKKLLEK